MAAKTASLSVNIIGDASKAKAAFKDAENAAGSFSKQTVQAGKAIASAFVGTQIVSFAKDSIKAASNLGESMNAVQVVFGNAAGGILKFGETASKTVGMSQSAFNSFAVQFAGFTKQIAGANGDVGQVTQELTTRIADFASVMNLDVPRAAQIFQSSLAGSTEPIRAFGIDLSAAAVEAFALSTGMAKSKGEMTEAIKVQARYQLLMQETSNTAGDFANTSDSLANRQRILAAEFENVKAKIGEGLIPVMEGLLGVVGPVFDAFNKLPAPVREFGTLIAVSLGVTTAFGNSLKNLGLNARVVNGAMGLLNIAFIAFAINQQQVAKEQQNLNTNLAMWAKVSETTLERQSALTFASMVFAGSIKDGSDAMRQFAETSLIQAQRMLDSGTAQELLNISTAEGQNIINETAAATRRYNDDLEINQGIVDDVNGLTLKEIEAKKEYYRSLINARNGITEVTTALDEQKASFEDLLSATLSAFNSDIAYEKAKRATGDALLEVTELQKALTDGTYEGEDATRDATVASEDFYLAVLSQGAAAVRAAEDIAKKSGAELTAEQSAKLHREEIDRVAATLAPNSPLRLRLRDYSLELSRIERNISTTIKTIFVEERRVSNLNKMAFGGIVRSPTKALIGEAGAEVVIPLTKPDRAMQLMQDSGLDMLAMSGMGGGGGGGGTTIVVNVQAGLVSSPDQVGQQIIDAIRRAERRSGQVFAAA
jgi:hypothetical protein